MTFLPGETTQTISIPVKGDLIDEFDQLFIVVLTTPINAAISDGKGLGTILDNDAPATITINDVRSRREPSINLQPLSPSHSTDQAKNRSAFSLHSKPARRRQISTTTTSL